MDETNITTCKTMYGPEWLLLELVATGFEDTEGFDEYIKLLGEDTFNWGLFLEQAIYHKMLAMTASTLLKPELFDFVPPFLNHQLKVALDLNIHKTYILRREMERIALELDQRGIAYAATKGIVLESQIYGADGGRFLSDIDFMIDAPEKAEFVAALESLGYETGTVDWRTSTVRPLSRAEKLRYLTTGDHIPELCRRTHDPVVPYISVGATMSFLWSGRAGDLPLSTTLQGRVPFTMDQDQTATTYTLDSASHFLYVVTHLLKHAWLPSFVLRNNDVNLIRFADVYRLWHAKSNSLVTQIKEICVSNELERDVAWVLAHTDALWGTSAIQELGWESKIDTVFLHSAGAPDGGVRFWEGTMRDRLVKKRRVTIFPEPA